LEGWVGAIAQTGCVFGRKTIEVVFISQLCLKGRP
jgi:hypothetical protein